MMNLRMLTLVALMAFIPFNSSAQCFLSERYSEPPGTPILLTGALIEGTNDADIIDCSESALSDDGLEIYGYGGDDLLIGSKYDDFIAGGGGADTIYGGEGHDNIDGGANDDLIYGEGGNDVIFGGVGSSSASGVDCNLVVVTGSSYLTKGGSGDDIIFGGAGNDCINAGSGEDIVYGGDGYDTIEGGNHNDILHGGLGFDHINGGWHTDTCIDIDDTNPDSDGAEFSSCEITPDSAPFCGDLICDIGEDSCSCAADCGDFPGCGGSCDLEPVGSSCVSDLECCSNKCKGKPGSETCK